MPVMVTLPASDAYSGASGTARIKSISGFMDIFSQFGGDGGRVRRGFGRGFFILDPEFFGVVARHVKFRLDAVERPHARDDAVDYGRCDPAAGGEAVGRFVAFGIIDHDQHYILRMIDREGGDEG